MMTDHQYAQVRQSLLQFLLYSLLDLVPPMHKAYFLILDFSPLLIAFHLDRSHKRSRQWYLNAAQKFH